MALEIVYRAVAELRLDPGNPRAHPKKQIRQLADSITAFGFTNPILLMERNFVLAGHGRLLAAKLLGLEQVPTITISDLSLEQKRGLRIADNRIAQNSGWDDELLKTELQRLSLPESCFDLSLLGFASGEIDAILSTGRVLPDDDEIPPEPAKARTRPGDIWILGQHRIGCGDARDAAFVRQVMGPDTLADAVILDAPYNVSITDHASRRSDHREFCMARGEMTPEAYAAFLRDAAAVAVGVSRNGAVHFDFTDWRHLGVLQDIGDELYGEQLNLCVWKKSNAGMGSLYRSQHELVLVYRVGDQKHLNTIQLGRHGRHRTNVWDYPSVTSPRGSRRSDLALHPTTKPVAMIADAIQDVTRRGDVVLDPFLGSGTTLIAAERTGRLFRGVEIDPGYVDVAIERWALVTGLEPKRQSRRKPAPQETEV